MPLVHQVLLGLRVKEVDEVGAEGKVDLRAVGDAGPVLGGQVGGGDAQHHVAPHGVDVQVHLCLLYTSPSPRDRG